LKPSAQQFESLALEQMDMLYRVARRLAGNTEEASDLVQETYLRAFRSRDRFELTSVGIRPWLVRILHNLHVTRSQRQRRQPISTDAADLDATPAANEPMPTISASDFDHMDQRLAWAMNELPGEYQAALLLWAVEELSYKEIAEALEVPVGTVMSRLYRARQRISQLLQPFMSKQGTILE
jgi:RNA polymerase sigma-70 factor (ECF subfamily)